MKTLYEALRTIQLLVFGGLGVAAFIYWRRRRGQAAAWLAASFSSLALVVLTGRILPANSDNASVFWVTKGLIAVLALFPYFLYRFTVTFVRRVRWIYLVAAGLTFALVATSLLLPKFPKPGEPREGVFQLFLILFIVQWFYLLSIVFLRLWLSGKGQSAVARRRMRTMSLGALGLAISVVISGVSPAGSEVTWTQIGQTILGLATAPLFLLGFAPPTGVLVLWRRRDELKLREAEIGLAKATEPKEVAAGLLPHATALIGGLGALMYEFDAGSVGSLGLNHSEEMSLIAAAARRGKGEKVLSFEEEIWVPLDSGWLIFKTSKYTPFFGEEETKTLRALAVLTDLALARAELFERERQQKETMRDFVAIASHDLRTPITVLEGFTTTLEARWSQVSEDQKKTFIRSMGRQVGHLKRLVEDLLTVSGLEAGGLTTDPGPVEIRAAISQTIGDMGEWLPAIELNIESELSVHVDREHLDRMMTNYLRNAVIYGEEPISIEAYPAGEFIEILVKDQGAGVPSEFVPRLFGKFERANRKMAKAVQGTGLGLSIVRGLARMSGGEAWYEPNIPVGAVFGIRLARVSNRDKEQ
jgi:signal transduction histidine kinase